MDRRHPARLIRHAAQRTCRRSMRTAALGTTMSRPSSLAISSQGAAKDCALSLTWSGRAAENAGLLKRQHRSRSQRRFPEGALVANVGCCAGFPTPAMTRSATRWETGVGKAPRHEIAVEWGTVGAAALWGFGRGARLGKVGSNCPWPSHCYAGWVWTTGGAGVAEVDWQCHCGPI